MCRSNSACTVELTSCRRVFDTREARRRRAAERDAARQEATANNHRPGRRQQWIGTDIVLAWIDVFLDVMKHAEYFVSCGDGMEHRVLQWDRMAPCDTVNALESARIRNVVAEQPRGASVRGHYWRHSR